eukprot:6482185-Amphidinium_carterae.1
MSFLWFAVTYREPFPGISSIGAGQTDSQATSKCLNSWTLDGQDKPGSDSRIKSQDLCLSPIAAPKDNCDCPYPLLQLAFESIRQMVRGSTIYSESIVFRTRTGDGHAFSF